LTARPQAAITPSVFMIFTSERHLKILQEKDNIVLIGTYFDELVRHHPSLKDPVFTAIIMPTLDKILALWRDHKPLDADRSWYCLTSTTALRGNEDIPMEEAETGTSSGATEGNATEEPSGQAEELSAKLHGGNAILDFIDVMSHVSSFVDDNTVFITDALSLKFLNGLFHQAGSLQLPGLCDNFVQLGGLSRLTDLIFKFPLLPL